MGRQTLVNNTVLLMRFVKHFPGKVEIAVRRLEMRREGALATHPLIRNDESGWKSKY
jgi:hypothetical protein